jgi:hypothetical protein
VRDLQLGVSEIKKKLSKTNANNNAFLLYTQVSRIYSQNRGSPCDPILIFMSILTGLQGFLLKEG